MFSKFFKKEVSDVRDASKKVDNRLTDTTDVISAVARKIFTQWPYTIYVLLVGSCLAFCLGYFTGSCNQKPVEVVTLKESSPTDSTGTAAVKPNLPVDVPVVIGDRITIKRDFGVEGFEDVLNCIQALGIREYKINYSDRYYPAVMNYPGAYAFVLHNPEGTEDVYTQFVFPRTTFDPSGELVNNIPEITVDSITSLLNDQFTEVTGITLVDDVLTFQAMEVKLAGKLGIITFPDGEDFIYLSMKENATEPDEYCGNYLTAVQASVGAYYNQMYPKPTVVSGDIMDVTLNVSGQNVLVPSPRSGVQEVNVHDAFTDFTLNNTDTFGDTRIVVTSSQQDLFGFYEALEYIDRDVAEAYDKLYNTSGSIYSVETKTHADWSNVDAYYMDGLIGTHRVVTYVFFNPVKNNYSSISAVVTQDDFGINGEKLVNAISEQIEFVGETTK